MLDYRLTYDGRAVHDLGVGLACVEGSCDLEAGTAGSLSFTLAPTHPMASETFAVKDARHEVVLEDRGRELFRGRVTQVETDADATLTVTCEGQLAYLGDSTVRDYATVATDDATEGTALVSGGGPMGELVGHESGEGGGEGSGETGESALYVPYGVIDHLISEHNRHVGPDKSFAVGTDGGAWAAVTVTDGPTTLDELNRHYCEGQDRYLRARYENGVRYVDILDGGQGAGTQTVVFGENLMDFASARSWDDLVTAIVATGTADRESGRPLDADVVDGDPVPAPESEAATTYQRGDTTFGLETVGDGRYTVGDVPVTVEGDRLVGDELAARYGIFEVRRSYDAKTPHDLLRMAAADLDPTASNVRELESVDVTAFDLSATNPELEPIALLDWERVFARPYGIDQWMPCSKMHVDICRPESTTYHFGDVPATLTRRSALRMGLIQRGTGELIRRANGAARDVDLLHDETNRNSERIDGAISKAESDLATATDGWSAHLDEVTAEWYESLSDAEKEAAQGREELQRHLDELGGTLDGVQELADSARRTFYGVCSTGGSDPYKAVLSQYLTKPGGQEFSLSEGVVVEVLFQHADTSGTPYLNVAGTGNHPIWCYGANQGIWQDETVMRFVYASGRWQCTNAPLYGSPLVVGNPAQGNMYSDGLNLDMRIGADSYWHVDANGERVGLADRNHIQIGDSDVTFADVHGTNLSVGYDSEWHTSSIRSESGITVDGVDGYVSVGNKYGAMTVSSISGIGAGLSYSYAGTSHSFNVGNMGYYTGTRPWVMRSIVVVAPGGDTMSLSSSVLGFSDLAGYFLHASNGDMNAADFYVVGCEVSGNGARIKFDRSVSGHVRLNILGIPVGTVATIGDGPMPGPEAFGDPAEKEGAS